MDRGRCSINSTNQYCYHVRIQSTTDLDLVTSCDLSPEGGSKLVIIVPFAPHAGPLRAYHPRPLHTNSNKVDLMALNIITNKLLI